MRIRYLISLLLAVFLISGFAEAQMKYTPTQEYFAPKGKKKKSTKKPDAKVATKSDAQPAVTKVVKKKETSVYTTELRAGLGFFSGFPLSDFNSDTYTGYGVNADAEYFVQPTLSAGLNTGFQSFKYDEIHVGQGHYTLIPIQLRGTYYFKEGDFQPYAGLNMGIYLTHSKYDSIIEPRSYLDPETQLFVHKPGSIKPIDNKKSVFGISPMAGIAYKASENFWLNVNVRYNLLFADPKSKSVIGLNLGFAYSFGM